MLRTTCPNISVILNFGCKFNCWYCVWKGHDLESVSTLTDWDKLESFLYNNRDKGKVSISGGGDPLYQYDLHNDWWMKFFSIVEKLNLLVDIHTREKFINDYFWQNYINRCVFSSDLLSDDVDYLSYLLKFVKVRINHVVTANTTYELIDEYLSFQKQSNCQFTVKQLTGHFDNGMYSKICQKYPEIYRLDSGDYNIYYMPDNSIRDSFLN